MRDDREMGAVGGLGMADVSQPYGPLARPFWRSALIAWRAPLAVLAFVILLYSLTVPKWQTNDDVMMAMVAHGYGFIADADPRLLFSSVIWGHLAQAMPSFFDVQGYTWLTITTLGIAAVTYLWILERKTASFVVALLFVLAVFVRPLLLPQFTTVSGLITGAGIIVLLYAPKSSRPVAMLVLFVLFVSAGFWIRWRECVLMLIIFVPLFIDRALLGRRSIQTAFVALALLLTLSAYIDDAAYNNPEWRAFEAANAARVPYTDNRLAVRLADKPDLLEKFGYSANDLNMISWFFFVDQDQLRPERLNALTASVPAVSDLDFKFRGGLEGLAALAEPAVIGMIVAIGIFLLLRFNIRVSLCALLFVGAIFALGFMGRPGAIRVYYPIIVLLLACALYLPGRCLIPLSTPWSKRTTWPGIPALMAVLLIANFAVLYPEAAKNREYNEYVKKSRHYLEGNDLIYIWGAAIAFDRFYPLWTSPNLPSNLYALGVSSFAPYAVPFQAVGTEDDFYYRLENGLETVFIGYEHLWANVDTFCRERFDAKLVQSDYRHAPLIRIKKLYCR